MKKLPIAVAAAILTAAGVAFSFGQGHQPEPDRPVVRTATPNAPSPDAADPEDIAFAKRLSNAFKSVAHNVEPAVVHVTQRNRVYQRDFFGNARGSSVMDTGLGSGFIVSKDGYIVTNNHVISNGQRASEEIKVRFYDGREANATLVGRDELTDLAVLRVDPAELESITPVTFSDSDSLEVGEWVLAIGSPFGLSNTVTAGIVSAKGRSITPRETGRVHEDFIQTDAAINPGNSGGPLLNLQGEVVGINSAIASRSGGYQGIGFAIPSNIAKAVLENITAHGRVVRGWLGVDLEDMAGNQSAGPRSTGVVVRSVQENSPADKAGIVVGDVITKFQGRAMSELRLRSAIALTSPGTKVPLEVVRDGRVTQVTATLADQSVALGNTDIPALRVRVKTLERAEAAALRAPNLKGVVVTEVEADGRGNTNDVQAGDIIVGYRQGSTEGAIDNAQQFAELVARTDFKSGLQLNVIRDNKGFYQRGFLIIRD